MALATAFQERYTEAVNWLGFESPSAFRLATWEENTCEWIKTHQSFREWRSAGCEKPLWIHGIPGK